MIYLGDKNLHKQPDFSEGFKILSFPLQKKVSKEHLGVFLHLFLCKVKDKQKVAEGILQK